VVLLLTRVRTSFILANTEQLHSKIVQMSDRIRLLEDALETLQSQCSSQAHPLLAPEHLLVKSSLELYGINAHGPQAPQQSVHSDGSDSSPQPDSRASLSCSSLSSPGEEFYSQTAKTEVGSASIHASYIGLSRICALVDVVSANQCESLAVKFNLHPFFF